MKIPELITKWRESQGLTQQGFAELTGISKVTINQWEGGKTEPRASSIGLLCDKLGVSYQGFLQGPQSQAIDITKILNYDIDKHVELWSNRLGLRKEEFILSALIYFFWILSRDKTEAERDEVLRPKRIYDLLKNDPEVLVLSPEYKKEVLEAFPFLTRKKND